MSPGREKRLARTHGVGLGSGQVPLSFHHLAIRCSDLGACERFYREVLGLEVVARWPREGGGERSVWLGMADGFLALERLEHGPGRPPPEEGVEQASPWRDGDEGLHLVALRIRPDERRVWEARLAERGVPIVHRTRWTIYLRDPEGNRIGLSHHPEDAPS